GAWPALPAPPGAPVTWKLGPAVGSAAQDLLGGRDVGAGTGDVRRDRALDGPVHGTDAALDGAHARADGRGAGLGASGLADALDHPTRLRRRFQHLALRRDEGARRAPAGHYVQELEAALGQVREVVAHLL